MKTKVLLKSFVLIFLVITFTSTVLARSYAMRCKGGYAYVEILPKGKMKLQILFFKAKDHRKVGSNECAWLNRPLAKHEPTRLGIVCKRGFLSFSYSPAKLKNIGSKFRKKLSAVLNAIREGKEYFVHVKNKGKYFEITRFGF